jgi:hypothetical protein
MTINPRPTFISSTMVDDFLYRTESYLTQHHGSSIAYLDIDPLRWYIRTGRASTQFLGLLLQKKPYMIARKLHEGGSTDEAVQRIKDYIGFN